MPIGAGTSQPIGNFVVSRVDHHMKERMRCKCYLRYCDDTVGLARTKAEAWKMLNEYSREMGKLGLVVKAGAIVAPIAENHERRSKKRKRQRSKTCKRKKDRLSGL